MKRFLLFISFLLAATLACIQSGQVQTPYSPPTDPLQVLLAVTANPPRPFDPGDFVVSYVDELDPTGLSWAAWAEAPNEAVFDLNEPAKLAVRVNVGLEGSAALVRELTSLSAPIDGFTITLTAEGRAFNLMAGVAENDESSYRTYLRVDPADGPRTFAIGLDWLRLDTNSADENEVVDRDDLARFFLMDISGYVGPTGEGRLVIESLEFWQGAAPVPASLCITESPVNGSFLHGADANFVQDGEQRGFRYYVEGQEVDGLALLAAQGMEALRLRVWVGKEGPSKEADVLSLAARAYALGLQVHPVLFLTEDWADVGKQPVPEVWQGLSLSEQAAAVRDYSEDITRKLLATGIQVPYYAVGNEIDHGISGVFAEIDQRGIENLEQNIWPEAAVLIRAAIGGIRAADSDAVIGLQISQSYAPAFAEAFYSRMLQLGVDVEIALLSFYPTAFGPYVVADFCRTLDVLSNDLGLRIALAEFAYPMEPPSGGPFEYWFNDLPGYPLTLDGQANYTADFYAAMRAHPAVEAAYYFSPDFYWGGDIWGSFASFDQEGQARPAVGALGAE